MNRRNFLKSAAVGSLSAMFGGLWMEKREQIVVQSFDVPATWRVDRSFDWGWARPFSVAWWAESDGSEIQHRDGSREATVIGSLYRIAEWYGWNGTANQGSCLTASQVAAGIRSREETLAREVRPGPADNAIFNVVGRRSIADEMADNGVAWTRAPEGSRKQGWALLRDRLNAAGSADRPGLYVFEGCRHFIRTLPILPCADGEPLDVDTASEDHVADDSRYRVMASAE